MLGGVRRRAPSGLVEQVLDAPGVAFIARVLVTGPFWTSAVLKTANLSETANEVGRLGLEPAGLLAGLIVIVQAAGSASVILNRRPWLGAGALAGFTLLASLLGHPFWSATNAAGRFHEMNAFLANLGLIGGLLLTAILQHRDR